MEDSIERRSSVVTSALYRTSVGFWVPAGILMRGR